ncbi:unnamed protein product [Orchesella dallaii]|uniref:Aminoacyl-transfer RNA synthetases class-II family profile domain-containing protein n=1 Tax=Orchesella dallaii TaxID=48710 RepID=A0ABP1RX32_9HEXA
MSVFHNSRRVFLLLQPKILPHHHHNHHHCHVNRVQKKLSVFEKLFFRASSSSSTEGSGGSGVNVKKKKRKEEDKTPDIQKLTEEVEKWSKDWRKPPPIAPPSTYTFRSHTCGQLTKEDVGESVKLCGWLTFKRLNGTFMVLRDLYGVTQIYVPKELENTAKIAFEAPLESVLLIEGKVSLRPDHQRRSDQISGEIEVIANSITLLNTPKELRLAYNDLDKVDEELAIQYRHLYIRNPRSQSVFRKRALFLGNVRRFMDSNHFIEVETPTLVRRTPGGAREFPVVTKVKDAYYALAQSPQILKQLLMCGGMDKYYQIARCYRDEGGKPDRQPEFTQLDIEMSFTTREDVMRLVEDLLKYSLPEELLPSPLGAPFPVMSYAECMSKYNSDKPDTGGFLWVVDFPLFIRGEESNQLEAAHHPFTMPKDVEELYKAKNDSDFEKLEGLSYDLVYCGAEVGGGSVRIHDVDLQKHVFGKVLGLNLEEIDYLLEGLESGAPPHGGFALGVDRFLAKVMGTRSIRDVIAFPKTSQGKDALSGAPTGLDPEAKKYYGIK